MTIPPQPSPHAHYWDLDPEVQFLNHGSFGACPRAILERQGEIQRQLERQPVRFFARELEPLLDAVREELGAFVGADPDDLALISNATTGVNTVLSNLRFEPGDELLVTDHEYNACHNALERVAAQWDARIVIVPVPFPIEDPARIVADLEAATTERTRLLLVDYITSPTALIMPMAEIVRAMSARGVDVLIDGAHTPGQVPLHLDELGAAYFTGNCHKWLFTPKGAAILHVRRDRQEGFRPLVVSHGANSPRTDRSRFRLEFDWTGTADPSPMLCIPDALAFARSLMPGGIPALRERNHTMALQAQAILSDALGMAPPCPPTMIGSMTALPLPAAGAAPVPTSPLDRDPLYDRLLTAGFELPIMPWPALNCRLLRVSCQAFNSLDQYQALADALPDLLRS